MSENFEPIKKRSYGYGDRPNKTDRTRSKGAKARTLTLKRERARKGR